MNLGFATRVPPILLRDPLAEVLGAAAPGEAVRYAYVDIVKAAGHSCPTVVGAFLMTRAALAELYGDELPVRGEIDVSVGGVPDDGQWGPLAQVLTHLTGAARDSGFGGLRGHFARRRLMRFDPGLAGWVRFARRDSGAAVRVRYQPGNVPASAEMAPLMDKVLAGQGSPEETRRFGELWQRRCEEILTGDPARVLTLVRET